MRLLKLIIIGVFGGIILALLMQLINIITGNSAYILLYNVDYIPLLKHFKGSLAFGLIFHFMFCIISVIGLFYLLKIFHIENYFLPYLFVYSGGSAILYFLSMLTKRPPAATDEISWLYWTGSHIFYGIIIGLLVKYWLGDKRS